MDSSSQEESVPSTALKRRRTAAPRQRASRKSVVEKKEAPKKEFVRAPKIPKEETVSTKSSDQRKAPTSFASTKAQVAQKRKRIIIVAVLLLIGISASAAVGLTDSGRINVTQVVEDRNERIRTNTANQNDTAISTIEVPVQNTNTNRPNGGLVGSTVVQPPTPPVPVVTTIVGTSSDQRATSTDLAASSTTAIESNQDEATEIPVIEEGADSAEESPVDSVVPSESTQ